MAFFGRDRTEAQAFSGPYEYRFVLDLERARTVAAMIAKSRSSLVIEMADIVAGMYLSNWERLSHYWREEDHERVESFLRRICQISPQRWNSWITFYDAEHRRSQRSLLRLKNSGQWDWRALLPWKDGEDTTALRPSADLAAALRDAQAVTPFRDGQDDRQLPIITTECLLLCVANTQGSQFARELVESGLDLPKLDQEARNPKHAPAG